MSSRCLWGLRELHSIIFKLPRAVIRVTSLPVSLHSISSVTLMCWHKADVCVLMFLEEILSSVCPYIFLFQVRLWIWPWIHWFHLILLVGFPASRSPAWIAPLLLWFVQQQKDCVSILPLILGCHFSFNMGWTEKRITPDCLKGVKDQSSGSQLCSAAV